MDPLLLAYLLIALGVLGVLVATISYRVTGRRLREQR